MAQIDVSELILDPVFVDQLTLIRRTPTINSKGENTLVETPVTTVGSVQPASNKQLSRLPEALQIADVRSFFIKIEIITDGASKYPDIIVFGAKRFQVLTAAPWLNFGGGWNEGVCVAEAPAFGGT